MVLEPRLPCSAVLRADSSQLSWVVRAGRCTSTCTTTSKDGAAGLKEAVGGPAGAVRGALRSRTPETSLSSRHPERGHKLAPMYVHCAHDFINKLIKRAYVHVCKIVPTLVYDNHPPPPH